jgi:ribosomal silencing factor RsfS
VVHIFVEESRRFYEIERLYKDIVPVSWWDKALAW